MKASFSSTLYVHCGLAESLHVTFTLGPSSWNALYLEHCQSSWQRGKCKASKPLSDSQSFHPEVTTSLLLTCHWPHVSSITTGPLTLNLRARQTCHPSTGIPGRATGLIPLGRAFAAMFTLRQRAEPSICSLQTGRSEREWTVVLTS